jgi:hypothetical protein
MPGAEAAADASAPRIALEHDPLGELQRGLRVRWRLVGGATVGERPGGEHDLGCGRVTV